MLSFQKISRFNEVSNGTVSTGLWKKGYTAIQRANTLLANYDNITFKTNETAVQASYKAEAMFLRGHFYFELARFFGNIPLITKPVSGEEWKGVTQNSADEVYAQIGKDMTEAILALPASYDAANKGRITVWAAKAELLRITSYNVCYTKLLRGLYKPENYDNSIRITKEKRFNRYLKGDTVISYLKEDRGGTWPGVRLSVCRTGDQCFGDRDRNNFV